jgi:recombination protein RecR
MQLPQPIRNLIAIFARVPSIGPRQATRMVFHLLGRGNAGIAEVALAVQALDAVKYCERCYFIHDEAGPLCSICANPNRLGTTLLVVEKETDILSIENTGKYTGKYFIIGPVPKTGALEPWQRARLEALKKIIAAENQTGRVQEIILGFNPTSAGDFNAATLARELTPYAAKLTRLGRGLPTGGEIEFADDQTLENALSGRS